MNWDIIIEREMRCKTRSGMHSNEETGNKMIILVKYILMEKIFLGKREGRNSKKV